MKLLIEFFKIIRRLLKSVGKREKKISRLINFFNWYSRKDKYNLDFKDEILKKYVLEDFLEKLRKLTPNQTLNTNYKHFPFSKKKD